LRGALWEIYQSPPSSLELPGYWAIWSALLLAAVELSAARPGFIPWLLQMVTLITTSILFFYTQNFWLCWALHATVQLIGSPSTHLPQRWSSLFSGPRRGGCLSGRAADPMRLDKQAADQQEREK
jgi:hypothetical protein